MNDQRPIRRMPRPEEVRRMTTEELRSSFLVEDQARPGEFNGIFTDLDRLVLAQAMPLGEPLMLPNARETGRATFLERREMGAINTGGGGWIEVDGLRREVPPLACAYVPMGASEVWFGSHEPEHPAVFWMLSCPAHRAHAFEVVTREQAHAVALGSLEASNERVIRQYIHEGGIPSCQLVMGYTEFAPGSVWNTFPPHTHHRRSEVYHYFDLDERVVAHFMGEPHATRHLFVRNRESVLSPSWSIHSGCGQGRYRFIWGMAGENQHFGDMDPVVMAELR